jgi:hypothetical protein
MRIKLIIFFPILFLQTSCTETKSNDPIKIYKYWTGLNPTKELNLINGQYWKSSHWANEYIIYLELKPSQNWWTNFKNLNKLKLDTTRSTLPNNKPIWFNTNSNFLKYKIDDTFDQGSRYYRDTLTGKCLIYEIQL